MQQKILENSFTPLPNSFCSKRIKEQQNSTNQKTSPIKETMLALKQRNASATMEPYATPI